ncbi:MAG: PKD domain-containing protein [Chitinophagaceae bacterium]|nr:MAG: PKD domain-containing protein [Chitinophagaceae bacterium]
MVYLVTLQHGVLGEAAVRRMRPTGKEAFPHEKHQTNLMHNEIRPLRTCLLALLFILGVNTAQAQLRAGFTATPRTGCAPIVVNFIDTSSGVPDSWHWDLGNGVLSSLRSPSTTYLVPGTYTVKLVVTNATGSDSVIKTDYITVLPSPTVDFTGVENIGCAPLNTQFTSTVTSTTPVISYSWDLGDGNPASVANPVHNYPVPGLYTITLLVTNSSGCSKAVTKDQYIKVGTKPVAGFTNSNPNNCTVPHTVNFTNTSTGTGNTYQWDFGDGGNSTQTSPSHTYTTAGTYSVKLVVTNPFTCRDSVIRTALVNVGSTTAFTVGTPICVGENLVLTNNSAPIASSQVWDFGDATTSTAALPVKSYATPGTYVVKLTNQFGGGCSDFTTHSVTVLAKPTVDFAANQTVACSAPLTVNFTSTVTGASTYAWTFGDGGTSSAPNPTHTYSTTGFFTVTLTVTGANGCTATETKTGYISVQNPQISISGLPKSGCSPLTIDPIPTVQTNEAISTWAWTFGDGGTSNLETPTYTYTGNGSYTVTLTVTTVSGCTSTLTMTGAVNTSSRPTAAFSATPTSVCATNSVQFTNNSTNTTPTTTYQWNFGDGGVSGQINPNYVYQDTGTFSVMLVAVNGFCRDTLLQQNLIKVLPPIARFTFAGTCADKLTKTFDNNSVVDITQPVTYDWDFGDGSAHSNASDPSYTYAASGTYTVTLTVTQGSCTHTVQQVVRVVAETPAFTASTLTNCKGAPFTFTATGINAANVSSWLWDFGDATTASTPGSATHAYSTSNTYTVSLNITDINGCVSSANTNVTVSGPFANFTPANQTFCLQPGGNDVSFSNISTGDGSSPIVDNIWTFGDTTPATTDNAASVLHHYAASGTYTVQLEVRDANGCSGYYTATNAVIISRPTADFTSSDTVNCTNRPIAFTNNSTGSAPLNYDWDFGDGSPHNTQFNPIHNYAGVDTFSVTLTVTDQYGCSATLTRPDFIKISYPFASFTASSLFGNCPPLKDTFVNNSLNFTSQVWDFGDGSTSSLRDTAFKIYNLAGTFQVKLTVTGPGGCVDDTTQTVEILGPQGTLTYNPLSGCAPVGVSFAATSTHSDSLIWDFGDGNTLWVPSAQNLQSHTFADTGSFLPRIILKDNTGCTVSIFGNDIVHSYKVFPGVNASIRNLCDSGIVNFSGLSQSNEPITNWVWNFGDGSATVDAQNPQHNYTTPGIYTATLTNTSQSGCTGTASTQTITVHVSPQVDITPLNPSGCVPATINFGGTAVRNPGSATMTWDWRFGNGNVSAVQNPGNQLFGTVGVFPDTLIAIHPNGCRDTATRSVTVFGLPVIDAGIDTALCRGNAITLIPSGGVTYVWTANPSLSCTTCPTPSVNPTSNQTFFVTGTDANGCSKLDSVHVVVHQAFSFVPPVLRDSLCLGGTVQLNTSGGDTYLWTPADFLNDPTLPNPTVTPTKDTVITYTVNISDRFGCNNVTATSTVHVFPMPVVDAGPDLFLSAGSRDTLRATVSPDVTSYQWVPSAGLTCASCPRPEVLANHDQIYRLLVRNAGGCTTFDDMRLNVLCGSGNFFFPNTFSPNGDGMNDVFYPRGTGVVGIRSFRIYNRWGEVVFERTNIKANNAIDGWDGMLRGKKAAADVYIYTAEIICTNNSVIPVKGDLTLLQ